MFVPYLNIQLTKSSFMYIRYDMEEYINEKSLKAVRYYISLKYIDGLKTIYYNTKAARDTQLAEILNWFQTNNLEYVDLTEHRTIVSPYNMTYCVLRPVLEGSSYTYYVDTAFTDPDKELLTVKFINRSQAETLVSIINQIIKDHESPPPTPIISDKFEVTVDFGQFNSSTVLGIIKESASCIDISINVVSSFNNNASFSIGTIDNPIKFLTDNFVDLEVEGFYNHKHYEQFNTDQTLVLTKNGMPTTGVLKLSIIPS